MLLYLTLNYLIGNTYYLFKVCTKVKYRLEAYGIDAGYTLATVPIVQFKVDFIGEVFEGDISLSDGLGIRLFKYFI